MLKISELCRCFGYIKSMKIETLIQKLQLIQERQANIDVVMEDESGAVEEITAICMTQIKSLHKEDGWKPAVKLVNLSKHRKHSSYIRIGED